MFRVVGFSISLPVYYISDFLLHVQPTLTRQALLTYFIYNLHLSDLVLNISDTFGVFLVCVF